MSEPTANAFADIAARMLALKGEPEVGLVCFKCEGGGWEHYGTGHNDPHFRECAACGNPEGLRQP